MEIHATLIRFKCTPTPWTHILYFNPFERHSRAAEFSFTLLCLLLRKITGRGGCGAQLRNGPHDCLPQRRKVAGREKQANDVTLKQNSWKTEIPSSFHNCSAPTWRQRNQKASETATFLKTPRPQRMQTKTAIVPTRLRFTPVHSVNSVYLCVNNSHTWSWTCKPACAQASGHSRAAKRTRAQKKGLLVSLSDTQCCFGLAHHTSA